MSLSLVGAVTGPVVAATVATAAPAATATWVGPARIVPNASAPLDWCPGNSPLCQNSQALTTLGPNTAITMVCWVDTNRNEGYKYGRWFYVTSGSVQGFVKAELVTNQYPYSPSCDSGGAEQLRAVMASLEATGGSELYQKQPTAADQANALKYYNHTAADWGPHLDWSGDCVMWVALAWLHGTPSARMHSAPTAKAIGASYPTGNGSNGTRNTNLNPPRGAAVFWSYGTFGHVALSLGNGMLVTTVGYDTSNYLQPTTNKTLVAMNASGYYMGWVAAP